MDGKGGGSCVSAPGPVGGGAPQSDPWVFDLDNASWAYKTREYLERAEQAGRVVWLGDDLPRSFVVVGGEAGPPMIYISQLPRNPAEAGGGEPV